MRPDILLHSGRYFDFSDPASCEFDIYDIAHALSHACRFGGHVRRFYSVAQHCVLASYWVTDPAQNAYPALMRDAPEAFIGDVCRPLKALLPDYEVVERRVERAVFERFGVPYPLSSEVKAIDLELLATERRDLMPRTSDAWSCLEGVYPLSDTIEPWEPTLAKQTFLNRFHELVRRQPFYLGKIADSAPTRPEVKS